MPWRAALPPTCATSASARYGRRVLAAADAIQAVFLMVVLVLGYAACFAIWWFGFRGRGDGR
jgi:hypothetical protein